MNSLRLTGLVAATHTPFQPDGSLHLAIVERQAEHLLRNGVRFAFIGGTTGECHSLSLEERRQLARCWIEVARGTPLNVVVHVGANCLADARALASQAGELGAVAIAALAPSYFKPRTVEALTACCADIASAAPATPFYYYDIPSMTGVSLPMPEFLARARERIPTLAGVKFSNADLMAYQLCLHTAGGAFDVPYGTDEWILAALALGARGAVGSTYNFAAPIYHRLIAAFAAGDLTAARREQFRSVQLVQTLARYGYLSASKVVMRLVGVDVGPARLPLVNLTENEVSALRAELETLGFFDWLSQPPSSGASSP
ncbi:MAG: dihydrodipicolinate synthase family protein [Verrucomicrobia bacterium]|jgi:N-acetylneuraminate lyase|nr:dihydrodipicolinate synthase family protein [Verrucomicrobiota bacterium]